MQNKKPRSTDQGRFFRNPAFKKAAKNIRGHCTLLVEEFTLEEEVKVVLQKKLANKKQPGPDSICNEVWKCLSSNPTVLLILARVFTSCMQNGALPDEWAKTSVFLIYKSADPSNPANYRPIALANGAYKIYTRQSIPDCQPAELHKNICFLGFNSNPTSPPLNKYPHL
jgi:hypothetical protein